MNWVGGSRVVKTNISRFDHGRATDQPVDTQDKPQNTSEHSEVIKFVEDNFPNSKELLNQLKLQLMVVEEKKNKPPVVLFTSNSSATVTNQNTNRSQSDIEIIENQSQSQREQEIASWIESQKDQTQSEREANLSETGKLQEIQD